MPPVDLIARIRDAFLDTTVPLWFPDLTADLAEAAWSGLPFTPLSYGTARMSRMDSNEPREVIPIAIPPEVVQCEPLAVELLPKDLSERLGGGDIRFMEADEVEDTAARMHIVKAVEFLASVPTVMPTISRLVRALHLIDSGNDEIDVSFSDPKLPFSAFVSMPGPEAVAGSIRLAEAILHEAMHLQLSFVEQHVPLVIGIKRSYFSPWRNEYRTAQGVLHAVYVFRVIDRFLALACIKGQSDEEWRCHAAERRATIRQQVHEIADFRDCPDLTADGRTLVARLLD